MATTTYHEQGDSAYRSSSRLLLFNTTVVPRQLDSNGITIKLTKNHSRFVEQEKQAVRERRERYSAVVPILKPDGNVVEVHQVTE